MPRFANRRLAPFTPQQMYQVVADVERYPEFLPLCESLTVLSRSPSAAGETLCARMGVGYRSAKETFTTRVELRPAEPAIDVAYLDGPFHHLQNRWRFLPAPAGCEIDFFIAYEFRSRMLGLLMGAMFDQAFRQFSAAFEERAGKVYAAT